MPYYYFDRFPQEALRDVEDIADEFGLRENYTHSKEGLSQLEATFKEMGLQRNLISKVMRVWEGDVLDREKEFERGLLMTYSPDRKFPLMVQTYGKADHSQEDIRDLIKRLKDMSKAIVHWTEFGPDTAYPVDAFD